MHNKFLEKMVVLKEKFIVFTIGTTQKGEKKFFLKTEEKMRRMTLLVFLS